MKYFFGLLIVFIFPVFLKAQATFEIILDNSKSAGKIDKVDMFDFSQQEYFSQPFKRIVKFSFKKKHIDSYFIVYFSGDKRIRQPLPIWLDKGKVKIFAHIDSFKLVIDTVYNSPAYYNSGNTFKEVNHLLKEKDTISANGLLISEYKKNASNPFSVDLANRYIQINQLNKQRLKPLKELMDTNGDKLKWYQLYDGVKDRLNRLLAESIIDLNDFNFTGTNGKITKATVETAENIVLDFWFLQCAGCIADHKVIRDKIKLLKDKNIELIGVSTDKDIEPWQNYLLKNDYRWQNLYIGKKHGLYSKLYLNSFPYYIILNKKGELKAICSGFSEVLAYFDIKSN